MRHKVLINHLKVVIQLLNQEQKENNLALFVKEKEKYGHLQIKEVFQKNVVYVRVLNI
jgi:hypothetical protein